MARAVVLLYHRIAGPGPGPRVSERRFEGQLDVLGELADVVPLAELAPARLRRRPRVAITFDDGYADNATRAAPLLDDHGYVATFFVATADRDRELWPDRLTHLLLDGPSREPFVDLEACGPRVRVDVRSPELRRRALDELKRRLRSCPGDVEAALAAIAEQTGNAATACAEHRRLDDAQIRELARRHEIGAHGRTHRMLSALDDGSLRDELDGSRQDLRAIVGGEIPSLAYPYGGPRAFDDRVVAAARRAGFRRACVTVRGPVRGRADPFRIPRYAVHDWAPDAFRRELSSWLRR